MCVVSSYERCDSVLKRDIVVGIEHTYVEFRTACSYFDGGIARATFWRCTVLGTNTVLIVEIV